MNSSYFVRFGNYLCVSFSPHFSFSIGACRCDPSHPCLAFLFSQECLYDFPLLLFCCAGFFAQSLCHDFTIFSFTLAGSSTFTFITKSFCLATTHGHFADPYFGYNSLGRTSFPVIVLRMVFSHASWFYRIMCAFVTPFGLSSDTPLFLSPLCDRHIYFREFRLSDLCGVFV